MQKFHISQFVQKITDYQCGRSKSIIYISNITMPQLKLEQSNVSASQPIQLAHQLDCQPLVQSKQQEEEIKKHRWSDQEHVLYILFLQLNRDKIKSKLIRRSNQFYKEMAVFIKGKNGIQCRSHHQKYETRYKYPHKIIKEEKEKLNQQLYHSLKANLEQTNSASSLMTADAEVKTKQLKVEKKCEYIQTVGCQTDIQGVNQPLLRQEQLFAYYNWLSSLTAFEHARMHNQLSMFYAYQRGSHPYSFLSN